MGILTDADLSRFDAIILDLDNTILDTRRSIREGVIELCREKHVPFTEEGMRAWQASTRRILERRHRGEFGHVEANRLRGEALGEIFGFSIDRVEGGDRIFSWIRRSRDFLPGAFDAVKRLASTHPLAIGTNGAYHVQYPRLEETGLLPYFKELFISDRIGADKPSEAFYRIAVETLGTSPARTLMIGDEPDADVIGAHRAGLCTCHIYGERNVVVPEADFRARLLSDL